MKSLLILALGVFALAQDSQISTPDFPDFTLECLATAQSCHEFSNCCYNKVCPHPLFSLVEDQCIQRQGMIIRHATWCRCARSRSDGANVAEMQQPMALTSSAQSSQWLAGKFMAAAVVAAMAVKWRFSDFVL